MLLLVWNEGGTADRVKQHRNINVATISAGKVSGSTLRQPSLYAWSNEAEIQVFYDTLFTRTFLQESGLKNI